MLKTQVMATGSREVSGSGDGVSPVDSTDSTALCQCGADTTADRPAVAALVRALYDGQIRAEALSMADRQRCVDHLTLEGFCTADIAELMGISERTVRRDRAEVRREHAVVPDARLGDELMGEFQRLVLASVQRLVRMSRDPGSPAYARLWAEEAIARNYQRLIDTAHRLRYFSDGSERLAHQRLTDPQERKRHRERVRGMLAMVRGG